MSETPMEPTIDLEDRRGLTVCQCCGAEDGTVRCLRFRWSMPAHRQGGGTSVALCAECRDRTREALRNE